MSTLRDAISVSDVPHTDRVMLYRIENANRDLARGMKLPESICRIGIAERRSVLAVLLVVLVWRSLFCPAAVLAADAGPLQNWFDDPFVQVRGAMPTCPVPLGPLTTGEEMQTQAHNRSERGMRCWQEGRCSRPNSFLYDKDIAAGVRARFASSRSYRTASLWVTVQRRIVWIEGCVRSEYVYGQ